MKKPTTTIRKTKSKQKKTVAASSAGGKVTRIQAVTDILKKPAGSTAAAIAAKFGLEEHTVRAMICRIGKTATVSTSKEGDKPTVYRIAA